MFDFDWFVNRSAMEIFGEDILVIPANSKFDSFKVKGDFHKSYQEVNNKSQSAAISSEEIVLFVREKELPSYYPKLNQGDYLKVKKQEYQIIDIQCHIEGSKKLVLHESSEGDYQE